MNPYIVLKSALALLGLWFFICYLWRDFRLDSFREDIFSVRDRMFLYAAQGNIGFDHPAYAILRNRMNILLRYGHVFTLTKLLAVRNPPKELRDENLVQWEAAVERLPEAVQFEIRQFNLSCLIYVLQHVMYYSFFRYLVLRPLVALWNPFDVQRIMRNRPRVVDNVQQLESDAVEQESRQHTHAYAGTA
jgi:hypothetical protein